ncbi:MAG: ABC transporter ATP-binding protein [Erysipelotrichaceae bacterium]|nr:ABC transporter ATP-binding protein [Erysipelotrichaceae bacterium]
MNKKKTNSMASFKRLIKTIFSFYPVLLPIVIVAIILNAVISTLPSIFMQNIIAIITDALNNQITWAEVAPKVYRFVAILLVLYVIALSASLFYQRKMADITQGSLCKFRIKMFSNMQTLPIRYFDTNPHGDIMSVYTNDTDTLRQLIGQSLPQMLTMMLTVTSIVCIMLYYSIILTVCVLLGVVIMVQITRKIGGQSAKYFVQQQIALGESEGFIEEMMNGQKVVKVFNHEAEAIADFDKVNDHWADMAEKANRNANILGPILHNMGNIMYVFVAIIGGLLLLLKAPNPNISGLPLSVAIIVPFLSMTRQFAGNIGSFSQQINSIIMGLAGAERIFELLDQEPEKDEGYVTLVNVKEENGELIEVSERTGIWAWKHPHKDGTITYHKLVGDIEVENVDFSYNPGKQILYDVTLYAEPGTKVAFVGATGAGKTTITNLINRFYDINAGKIRYDFINIDKIKKQDLRRSLGVVLQETNLFTGTVMDNIRYGRLDATDEECIDAAKLAGAHDFIIRLPEGYQTHLTNNGSNLSQGQCQLLAIARAAVADPPVMILDEATSSIDTRTEAIVSAGMDRLMEGRTVFVIAHRLSTVRNSDIIMVLDHGVIIERGTHLELLATKGQYYQLYTGAFELE